MTDLGASCDDSLKVDENDCDKLTSKLMLMSFGSTTDNKVTKQQLRHFTEQVLENTCKKRKFNEDSFERGFARLDPEKKGYVEFEKIRDLVQNHF